MNRRTIFSPGEYYHIYNRGVDKRVIFLDRGDYVRFLKLLYLCNSSSAVDIANGIKEGCFMVPRGETLVDIGAYCLMPNHFHLLIKEKDPVGISVFMKKVCTGYAMYFNLKYKRSGGLFQGTFKSVHITEDKLLEYLYAYIHLNPIKIINPAWKEMGITDMNAAKQYLDEYSYSSYIDYSQKRDREAKSILVPTSFPNYFPTASEFNLLIDTWLDYQNENPKVTPPGQEV